MRGRRAAFITARIFFRVRGSHFEDLISPFGARATTAMALTTSIPFNLPPDHHLAKLRSVSVSPGVGSQSQEDERCSMELFPHFLVLASHFGSQSFEVHKGRINHLTSDFNSSLFLALVLGLAFLFLALPPPLDIKLSCSTCY